MSYFNTQKTYSSYYNVFVTLSLAKNLKAMKKVLFFICTIAFISCSKEEDSSSFIKHNTANFSLSKNLERADWSNIQTGETIKIDIKIDDFDTDPSAVYVLKPITINASQHQKNKIDYNFQEEIKIVNPNEFLIKDSIYIKKTQDSIILKKSKSSFFVTVLQPGNFTQQYELRKMYLNKYVAGSTQEILFSAVKIDVYTWNQQTDNSTMFSASKHSRYYEFTIDDRDQTNDTYLTNTESKQNTYAATYNGNKFNGNVAINQVMTYSEKINTEKGAQVVPTWILSELKITQKRSNELDNIITYSNLNIRQK